MTRKDLLEKAMQVTTERAVQHGRPENVFEQIANLWSAYLGLDLGAVDVSMMMVLFKVARAQSNPQNEDNWVDMAGYAACGAELAPEVDNED